MLYNTIISSDVPSAHIRRDPGPAMLPNWLLSSTFCFSFSPYIPEVSNSPDPLGLDCKEHLRPALDQRWLGGWQQRHGG